eukprot:5478598-Amphidinium_carterae.1
MVSDITLYRVPTPMPSDRTPWARHGRADMSTVCRKTWLFHAFLRSIARAGAVLPEESHSCAYM